MSVGRSVGLSVEKKISLSPLVLRTFVIPYSVPHPSWILRVICYSVFCPTPFFHIITLQLLASCCRSCVLTTTELKYEQLLASLRIMVDCTLYHVLFNSSPNRKLNFYHVWTLCMYKLPVIYVTWTQTLNQVGCMYNFSMTIKILVYEVHSTLYRVLIISNICQ